MVIAGINAGANLGDDVLYSGTVAAATEGRFLGLPAVAVSLTGTRQEHFDTAANVALKILARMKKQPLPSDTILNINVPDLPWGKLGMSICYDIRFPNMYRYMSKSGAKFISVPSAFTATTGKKHWHILLKARAIENFCYIFAPNQTGKNTKKRETFGHSVIISPDGKILKIKKSGTGVIYESINPKISLNLRKVIPSLI